MNRVWYQLCFKPLDVLWFRDERPFDAGSHFTAQGQFPRLSVFLGAIRTKLVETLGGHFRQDDFGLPQHEPFLGTRKTHPQALHLAGPFVRDDQQIWTMAPRDIYLKLDPEGDPAAKALRIPKKLPAGLAVESSPENSDVIWSNPHPKKTSTIQWMALKDLQIWQKGVESELHEIRCCDESKLLRKEPRIGTARNEETRAVEDQMFYLAETWRLPEAAGFVVLAAVTDQKRWGSDLMQLDNQTVRLGGKGHRAAVTVTPFVADTHVLAPTQGYFRLCLMSAMTWPIIDQYLQKNNLCLIGCSGAKPQPMGGFDLATQRPKPLQEVLAVGTVLFVEGPKPSEDWLQMGDDAWALVGQGN